MCAISLLTSMFAISSPDEFLSDFCARFYSFVCVNGTTKTVDDYFCLDLSFEIEILCDGQIQIII